MKNIVVCKNCGSENPFYGLNCSTCKSYLRERIYNIDLWKTVSLLIESPSKAFQSIIYSEHKNFLILIVSLLSGKMMLNGIFLRIFFLKENSHLSNYISNYLITLVLTVVSFLIISWLYGKILERKKIKTRFPDNLAIITFSFLPFTFGFIFLFPIELILFGEYIFYFSPSPFHIKETLAYTLLIFEILLLLWSLFLTCKAINIQTGNKIFSITTSLVIHTIYNLFLYQTAKLLFR